MILYIVLHLVIFSTLFLCLYLVVKPRLDRKKNIGVNLLFYLGVLIFGALFPILFNYSYSLFRPEYYGISFTLTGIYAVLMLTTSGWRRVTSLGKKDYRVKDNRFMFFLMGYGILLLIGCFIAAMVMDGYVSLFE